MTEHQEEAVPVEVQRRYDAAEAEEALYLNALHGDLRAMHIAQTQSLAAQVTWLRARTVDLNIALQEKDAELASLRSQLAGYLRSDEINHAAEDQTGEPGGAVPAP